jgi:tRNA dimethylallyltransferase
LNKIIAIVGSTASGKSSFALEFAHELKGQIINADSKQVFKFMDIGTGKPSSTDRGIVKHHLYNIVDPDEDFSLGTYLELARSEISIMLNNGILPIIVGGTAQYLWALIEGWDVPKVKPNPSIRKALTNEAASLGSEALHDRLEQIDPRAAGNIHPRNLRRIIRALEVIEETGSLFSDLRQKKDPTWKTDVFGMGISRSTLAKRIQNRVHNQLSEGWIEEVSELLKMGYDKNLPSFSALGYREVIAYLQGDLSLTETEKEITRLTTKFSNKQYGWFRLKDPRINWINTEVKDYNILAKEIANNYREPKIISQTETDLKRER